MTSLTSTGAAVLGLLSLRPWAAYELAQQSQRSLRFVLPRAESVIYNEPKKLVAQGWATSRTEGDGRRTRSVYEITDAGRAVLSEWLSSPSAEPSIVVEPLIRLLFSDAGEVQDVVGALGDLERWAAMRHAEGVEICRGYLAGDAPFPERLHLSVLFADFYSRIYEQTLEFAASARAEVESWDSTRNVGLTPGTRATLEGIVSRADAS